MQDKEEKAALPVREEVQHKHVWDAGISAFARSQYAANQSMQCCVEVQAHTGARTACPAFDPWDQV